MPRTQEMEGIGKAENNQMNKIVWKTEKLQHFSVGTSPLAATDP